MHEEEAFTASIDARGRSIPIHADHLRSQNGSMRMQP
jgi:hypothetical protein